MEPSVECRFCGIKISADDVKAGQIVEAGPRREAGIRLGSENQKRCHRNVALLPRHGPTGLPGPRFGPTLVTLVGGDNRTAPDLASGDCQGRVQAPSSPPCPRMKCPPPLGR